MDYSLFFWHVVQKPMQRGVAPGSALRANCKKIHEWTDLRSLFAVIPQNISVPAVEAVL